MPATDVSSALLPSLRDGTYPESEELLVSELPTETLSSLLAQIQDAKREFEKEIRQNSQEDASTVDQWIAQAKQIQADIAKSRLVAKEIVDEHQEARRLAAVAHDAEAKAALLEEEIRFNAIVGQELEHISLANTALNNVQVGLNSGSTQKASRDLESLTTRISELRTGKAQHAFLQRHKQLLGNTHSLLEVELDARIRFVREEQHQTIEIENDDTTRSILESFQRTRTLPKVVERLATLVQLHVLEPIIARHGLIHCSSVTSNERKLSLTLTSGTSQAEETLDQFCTAISFLTTHLPELVRKDVGARVLPDAVSTLVTDYLTPNLPLELSNMTKMQGLQDRAKALANLLRKAQWPGVEALSEWTSHAPRLWLTKRRMSSLDAVRKALAASRGPTRQVDRIERHKVSKEDSMFAVPGEADDWDAAWAEESTDEPQQQREDEDVSGWDFEDNDASEQDTLNGSAPVEVDESAEAWGWGDENQSEPIAQARGTPTGGKNGTDVAKPNGETVREVVLTETYTITDIPDHILEIIGKDIQDADIVKDPVYSYLHSTSASSSLLSLSTSVLAMFRATATTYYSTALSSGNMHLYNDSMFILNTLQSLPTPAPELAKSLPDDCTAMEKFARSAYAREMDVQRTVLGDLLDGAQGFTSCTQQPFAAECETAVLSTIDRLRAVHGEWKPVLSHSALLQSIGSLLNTVIEKIVKDIGDMDDISEPESQRLASFCSQISNLNDLFLREKADDAAAELEEPVPLTAVYVSNWLRFQYLANILESSLVDIKYLWTEGELSLEFSTEEVVDLIKALFADSSHRKNAIAEIRRNS